MWSERATGKMPCKISVEAGRANTNKHDKNAISTSIQSRLVGYLGWDRAKTFRRFMKIRRGLRALQYDAEIKGGSERIYL
jgi:hypothetical protein